MRETMKGNQNRTVHGGAAGVKALTRGEEFTGLPALRETEVRNELAEQGRPVIVIRNAVRLQTVADLYFDAAIAAMQAGELQKADGYIKQYGWLAGAALRAWGAVATDEKDAARGGGASVIDVLNSIERAKHGKADK